MIRLIPILLVIALLWGLLPRLVRHLRAQPPDRRRHFLNTSFLWLPALIFLVLAGIGRISFLTAGLALLLPLVRTLGQGLLGGGRATANPHRAQADNEPPRGSHAPPGRGRAPSNSDQTRALSILGLAPGASRDAILAAHRNLATKVHPDLGGSDYLTAEINWARDVLLKGLS